MGRLLIKNEKEKKKKKTNHISGSEQAELFFLCKNIHQFQSININTSATLCVCAQMCALCINVRVRERMSMQCMYIYDDNVNETVAWYAKYRCHRLLKCFRDSFMKLLLTCLTFV